jgi:lycopene cyclase domain-containing protein
MTYFEFLFRFLGPPLLILGGLTWWDSRQGRVLPAAFRTWPAWLVILAHIIVAVVYTTPWDNYLVATRVWWYDPELVSGIILGWVPLEEYIFFVLQTLMTGLWWLWLAKRIPVPSQPFDPSTRAMRVARWGGLAIVAAFWAYGVAILVIGWQPGTYLGLELAWALFPIMLQMAFGGDILWRYRSLVLATLIPTWLYLCVADYLAIGLGTWIIAPDKSVGLEVGHLPLEEIVFFLVTNMLIAFGMTLVMARESQSRAPGWLTNFLHRFAPAPSSPVPSSSAD